MIDQHPQESDPALAELGRDLAHLVRVDWRPARARRTELGLVARRRRKIVRTSILTAAALGALALALAAWPGDPAASSSGDTATNVSNQPDLGNVPDAASNDLEDLPDAATRTSTTLDVVAAVRFSDGSTATPLARDADLEIVQETTERIVVALGAGGARFDIASVPARTFRLVATAAACRRAARCDDISIDVFAAKFAVARETHRVHIEVYEGLLQVTSPEGVRELATGAAYDIPTNAIPSASRSSAPTAPTTTPKRDDGNAAPDRDADRDAPVAPLESEVVEPAIDPASPASPANADPTPTVPNVTAARDVLDELLLAADHKRKHGQPDVAVALLRQSLRDHPGDPRAPLVAFTLGRVLLQLKRPAEAGEAFATADRLAPHGPLAQDAVARQVEAMAAAGDMRGARSVAQIYIARFPDGRRLAEVRAWGGL